MMLTLDYVMPFWNRKDCVLGTLDTLLDSGTSSDDKIIAVDDFSTEDLASAFCGLSDKITYFRRDRKSNANACRFSGVSISEADIVSFIDSDDGVSKSRTSEVKAFFDAHPTVDVMVDNFITITGSEKTSFEFLSSNPEPHEVARNVCLHAFPITFSSISARRSSLSSNILDVECARYQDRDFLLNSVRAGLKVKFANTNSVFKFQRRDSFSRSSRGYLKGLQYLLERHSDEFESLPSEFVFYLYARNLVPAMRGGGISEACRTLAAIRGEFRGVSISEYLERYRAGRNIRRNAESAFIRRMKSD